MTYSLRRDLANEICVVTAAPRTTLTAGGAGDNTLVNGTAIDTTTLASPAGTAGLSPGTRYNSVVFTLEATSTLAAAATLIVTGKIQTAAASNFAAPVDLTASATLMTQTGPGGGGTVTSVVKLGVSLENALQYVRLAYTPDLSAANTDVGDVAVLAIFGGAQEVA